MSSRPFGLRRGVPGGQPDTATEPTAGPTEPRIGPTEKGTAADWTEKVHGGYRPNGQGILTGPRANRIGRIGRRNNRLSPYLRQRLI